MLNRKIKNDNFGNLANKFNANHVFTLFVIETLKTFYIDSSLIPAILKPVEINLSYFNQWRSIHYF